jgi:protein involved in polysaccharide export with SLBB domain
MKRCPTQALVLGFGLVLAAAGRAATETPVLTVAEKPEAPLVFVGSNAKTKGAWQQHFTLGPGDVLNFSLYGRPELTRTDVTIEPDGRISYLQAHGVMASGLTIDELRAVLTTELAKFHRRPRVVVTPGAFKSKKFFVLGKVVNKGAYGLDRPLTLLEGVTEAGGLETGLFQLNTVELADLPRSFLIRQNQRVPVDFEALFLRGDLTQNILLEPNDYLYFPSAIANEIYVLGSVKSPGAQGLTIDATVVSVITLAGGFAEKAYKQRVLVVRGSINQPQSFIVNAADVLAGKSRDFLLEPRDIVYIADRPWARVEDLADMAATAFIQTMVTVWTGSNIGPAIQAPILPSIQ